MKLKLITTTYTFLCFLLTYSHINHNLADLLTSLGNCSQPVVRFKIESLKTPMLSWQNRIGNNFSHTYGQYFGQQAAYLFPVYNFISFLFYTSFQCFLLDFFLKELAYLSLLPGWDGYVRILFGVLVQQEHQQYGRLRKRERG